MKSFLSCLMVSAAILTTTQANAIETKYEAQYMFLDSTTRIVSFEPNALQFRYIKPYNDFIDLDAMVALGINDYKAEGKDFIGTQTFKLSNIIGLFAKMHGTLEPKVLAYLQLGVTRVEYDISSSQPGNLIDGNQADFGFTIGLGLKVQVFEKGAFTIEFNQFNDVEAGDETLDTTSLGIGYQWWY